LLLGARALHHGAQDAPHHQAALRARLLISRPLPHASSGSGAFASFNSNRLLPANPPPSSSAGLKKMPLEMARHDRSDCTVEQYLDFGSSRPRMLTLVLTTGNSRIVTKQDSFTGAFSRIFPTGNTLSRRAKCLSPFTVSSRKPKRSGKSSRY
jgi:hypothetical protein